MSVAGGRRLHAPHVVVGAHCDLAVVPEEARHGSFTAIVPVILVAMSQRAVTPPELNIRSVDELVKRAKAAPGTMNYGSTGVRHVAHLAGAQFCTSWASIPCTFVQGRGRGDDLMAGRLQFMFATLPSVGARSRRQAAPDRPGGRGAREGANGRAHHEGRGYTGMENGSWFGLFAPKGTPQPIIDKLNAQINEILREKETQEHFERNGAEPAGGSPQDFARFIRREYETWRPVVQRTGATAD